MGLLLGVFLIIQELNEDTAHTIVKNKLSAVVHACTPATQEAEMKGLLEARHSGL